VPSWPQTESFIGLLLGVEFVTVVEGTGMSGVGGESIRSVVVY
jgi:hypothetical protein